MRKRLFVSRLLTTFITMTAIGTAAYGQAIDLTGTWELRVNDVQRSFCDGSVVRESVILQISITQDAADAVKITIPGDMEEQIFLGRTSNHFLAAESADLDQTTVLTGNVSNDGRRVSGTLVFFDKHPCPEAETGASRYRMVRVTP